MNTFYNQMFNPQYVNLQYFRQIEQLQYEAKQNEEVAKAVNELQKVKQELGYGDIQHYEPEYIPDNFVEDLLKAASQYVNSRK